MSQTTTHSLTQMGFQLKSSSCNFSVIKLLSADLNVFFNQLEDLLKKKPNLFNITPVVIDLHTLEAQKLTISITDLVTLLGQFDILPIGLRCSHAATHKTAIACGLTIFPEHMMRDQAPLTPSLSNLHHQPTKVITTPVRSGCQVYAKNSDLIVMAPVSPGAEVLADGNIHLYSTLHGRALAGIQGDNSAHIFCRSLEAELISIAGNYLVFEDLPKSKQNHSTHIYLKDEKLQIESLS
jgi:septum site-determining protein MinC